jgi:predicted nucleic acid-binding protein
VRAVRLVVDANVFFAALIRKGVTSRLMLFGKHELIAPQRLEQEFLKHWPMLLRKTHLSVTALHDLTEDLVSRSSLHFETVEPIWLNLAKRFSPDPDDTEYLALCLQEGCPLWSNDVRLKLQERVRVLTTQELLQL